MFANIKKQIQGKNWEQIYYDPNIIPELPGKSEMAKFRLITGRDCLCKYFHKIGVFTSETCVLYSKEEEMDAKHLENGDSLKTHQTLGGKKKNDFDVKFLII